MDPANGSPSAILARLLFSSSSPVLSVARAPKNGSYRSRLRKNAENMAHAEVELSVCPSDDGSFSSDLAPPPGRFANRDYGRFDGRLRRSRAPGKMPEGEARKTRSQFCFSRTLLAATREKAAQRGSASCGACTRLCFYVESESGDGQKTAARRRGITPSRHTALRRRHGDRHRGGRPTSCALWPEKPAFVHDDKEERSTPDSVSGRRSAQPLRIAVARLDRYRIPTPPAPSHKAQ
jgi:hypothetical protein